MQQHLLEASSLTLLRLPRMRNLLHRLHKLLLRACQPPTRQQQMQQQQQEAAAAGGSSSRHAREIHMPAHARQLRHMPSQSTWRGQSRIRVCVCVSSRQQQETLLRVLAPSARAPPGDAEGGQRAKGGAISGCRTLCESSSILRLRLRRTRHASRSLQLSARHCALLFQRGALLPQVRALVRLLPPPLLQPLPFTCTIQCSAVAKKQLTGAHTQSAPRGISQSPSTARADAASQGTRASTQADAARAGAASKH